MKTPREILLERHAQVQPGLDAVRRKALATVRVPIDAKMPQADVSNSSSFMFLLGKAWRELIWPSRHAWAGMAAVWLGVLVANLEMKASSAAIQPVRPAFSREMVRAFEERRRLLSELLPPSSPALVQVPQNENSAPAQPSSGNPKPKPETRNPKQTQMWEILNLEHPCGDKPLILAFLDFDFREATAKPTVQRI
jgi:hypothetical protein